MCSVPSVAGLNHKAAISQTATCTHSTSGIGSGLVNSMAYTVAIDAWVRELMPPLKPFTYSWSQQCHCPRHTRLSMIAIRALPPSFSARSTASAVIPPREAYHAFALSASR